MLQMLLPLALTLTPSLSQEGAGRDPAAIALLEQAARAARALHSAAYEAHSEIRRGGAQAQPAVADGRARFDQRGSEGGAGTRLAIDGVALAGAPDGADIVFKVACDGTVVRGRFGEEKVVWEGALDGDGAELLSMGEQLVMSELHALAPFADDLEAPTIQLGEEVLVGDVPCRSVLVQHGPKHRHAKHLWFFSNEDHLPRRRVAEVHSRGVFQIETLEITKLVKNPKIYPAVFEFPIAAGVEVKEFVSTLPKEPELLEVGSAAPEFSLEDSSGETHTLADYRGKVLVLDFWATWCPPCKQTMPLVQKIHERFAENEDVQVVGIATAERRGGDPADFMKRNGYTYPCLLNGETVAPAYKAFGLPTFCVIGREGRVLHASTGFRADLDQVIGRLIDETLADQGG